MYECGSHSFIPPPQKCTCPNPGSCEDEQRTFFSWSQRDEAEEEVGEMLSVRYLTPLCWKEDTGEA